MRSGDLLEKVALEGRCVAILCCEAPRSPYQQMLGDIIKIIMIICMMRAPHVVGCGAGCKRGPCSRCEEQHQDLGTKIEMKQGEPINDQCINKNRYAVHASCNGHRCTHEQTWSLCGIVHNAGKQR